MKKLFLIPLMALMCSVTAWAVGVSNLAGLQAAVANGGEITLTDNINVDQQIEIMPGKTVVLDLNGHTIAYTSDVTLPSGVLLVHNGASLTINDSSDPDQGQIISGIHAYAAIALTKKNDDSSVPAVLIVNGGKLYGDYYAITGNGSRPNTYIEINGGYITATHSGDNQGIYHPQNGTLIVNGGTIEAYCAAIEIRAGELEINGGSFTATAAEYSCNPNGSGTTTTGAAIAIAQHTTKKDITVTINGGTFAGQKAINESNPQANDPAPSVDMAVTYGEFNGAITTVDVHNFISGGTFSERPAADLCEDTFSPMKDPHTGKYIVVTEAQAKIGDVEYPTVAAAVAAATANQTVQLIADADIMSAGLTIDKNLTLDLNGHNIKVGERLSNNIYVPTGVKLTLVDNSVDQDGKIYTEEAYIGAATGYGVIRVSGEFLMQSGNIYAVIESNPTNLGQFAVTMGAGGKVTIEGGQIKAGWYAISNNGNNSGSTIEVKGGELISTADYAIYNPSKNSTVSVSDGVVYGEAGAIAMNRGQLIVTGGTITSKGQGSTGTWGDGTGGLANAAIAANGRYESVNVEISNGSIIAEGNAIMIQNGTVNPVTIAVSGGSFSDEVPAAFCAEGYEPAPQDPQTGKYTVKEVEYTTVRENLTAGRYYTMCLKKAVTNVKGATIWRILGKADESANPDVVLEEVEMSLVEPLDAGRPYIFNATADKLEVAYTGDEVANPIADNDNNGLVGTFEEIVLEANPNTYVIYNNALYYVAGSGVIVDPYRAYINMNEVPAPNQSAPVQGRRQAHMSVNSANSTTALENAEVSEAPRKVLINGQLFILRDGKMIDATGRVVK